MDTKQRIDCIEKGSIQSQFLLFSWKCDEIEKKPRFLQIPS